MKPGQSCNTCDFYSALGSECRARPPTIFIVSGIGGEAKRMSIFPSITPDKWCGEWREITEGESTHG